MYTIVVDKDTMRRAIFLSVLLAYTLADRAPLFLWTTGDGNSAIYRNAKEDALSTLIENTLASKTKAAVVLFLQDELSINDITQNAGVYDVQSSGGSLRNIKRIMKEHSSVFLQQQSKLTESLEEIREKYPSRIKEMSHSDLLENNKLRNIVSSPPLLIIIHMKPTYHNGNSLQETDDFIGSSTSYFIKSQIPFTGIFTGSKSAAVDLPIDNSPSFGRHLMSTTNEEFTFFNVSNCLYFYAQNISFLLDSDTWNLPQSTAQMDAASYCANDSAELSVTYTGVDPTLPSLNLVYIFGVTSGLNTGYWFLTNFSVTYNYINGSNSETATVDLAPYFITETPFQFSYSCYQLPNIPALNSSSSTKKVAVNFVGLQVQAFNIANDQFGYYNDCVGFFTITTWACLIVVFLLFIILAWGMVMISSINTPDHYDDPKGKTITVNTND